MAAKTLRANFRRMLRQERNKIKNLAGIEGNIIFDLTIGGKAFISGMQIGMTKGGILKAAGLSEKANSYKIWKTACTIAVASIKRDPLYNTRWSKGQYRPGRYIYKTPSDIAVTIRFIRIQKGTRGSVPQNAVDELAIKFRELVYEAWKTEVSRLMKSTGGQQSLFDDNVETGYSQDIPYESKQRGLVDKPVRDIITENTEVSHQAKTTKADMALRKLNASNPGLIIKTGSGIRAELQDILSFIDDNVEVNLKKTQRKVKAGLYTFNTSIKAKLEYNVKGSAGSDTKDWTDRVDRAINDFIEQEVQKGSSSKYYEVFGADPDGRASKTPRKTVAQDAALDIIRPLTKSGNPDMRFKINKQHSFKPDDRNIPIQKSKKKSPVIETAIQTALVERTTRSKRPQKEKREDTENTQKLKALINKRLPAQVRRNMGKPALTNRTGIFSNSAELISLRETGAGLSGEYTYMRTGGGTSKNRGGVYETFENTGKKRWPTGYNPKPLISKSIRDLAMQYTQQKLVSLRRI